MSGGNGLHLDVGGAYGGKNTSNCTLYCTYIIPQLKSNNDNNESNNTTVDVCGASPMPRVPGPVLLLPVSPI